MAAGGRKTGRIFILVALLLILLVVAAVVLLRDQIFPAPSASSEPTPIPATDLVKIAVLAQPVTHGTQISQDLILFVEYPRASLTEGLFFTEDQVVNILDKRAKFDLAQGTPLTPALITDSPAGSYASYLIPRGMVAVSIPISRLTSVAYALQPGDHVNIIGSLLLVDMDAEFQTVLPNNSGVILLPGVPLGEANLGTAVIQGGELVSGMTGRTVIDTTLNQALYVIPSEAQRPRLISQTLIQDVVVLWVGNFPEGELVMGPAPTPTPAPEGEGAGTVTSGYGNPDIISLIVSPQDAVTLNYLMLSGAQLNLALRGAGDDQRIPTEAVTLQFLMEQYGIPYPAKLPYGIQPRVDEMIYPSLENGQ